MHANAELTLPPPAPRAQPPDGPHPHGSRACYQGGCRRPECRAANAAYKRERTRAREAGEPPADKPLVDAGTARAHLEQLVEQGMSVRHLSRVTGLSRGPLLAIAHGDQQRITARSAELILAVQLLDPGEHPAGAEPAAPPVELDERRLIAVRLGKLDHSWRERAACRHSDRDLFHATGAAVAAALAVCAPCPVRSACLAVGLAEGPANQHGIWGGTTAEERRQLLEHQERAS